MASEVTRKHKPNTSLSGDPNRGIIAKEVMRKKAEGFADAHPNIALSVVLSTIAVISGGLIILIMHFLGISLQSVSHYLPALAIMAYIPLVCYSDIKSREMNPKYFIPLAVIGLFSLTLYFIESPARNYWFFGLTIGLCVIFFGLTLIRAIGFADAIFVSLILLIMQYNPFTSIRIFFALDFFWMVMIFLCATPIYIWIYNTRHKNKYPVLEMLTSYPRHIPYMVIISIAFIGTLIAEMGM